jgi:protein-disulfide isomerase
MKKNNNIFRATQMNNAMRILAVFCLVVVIGAMLLLITLPSNRQKIMGWFRGDSFGVTVKNPKLEKQNEEGINGAAVVNENIKVRPLSVDDHLSGNISAPVKIIIYLDFQCPFCGQLYNSVEQAKAEFGSDIVVAVRHFPLLNHDQALPAAVASECAADQDKFWEMYHELFAINQTGSLSAETIKNSGKKLKLDEVTYVDCLTKNKYQDKILTQKEEVRKLGVGGTPASFINDEYFAGALPYEDFTHPDGSQALGLRSLIKKKLGK